MPNIVWIWLAAVVIFLIIEILSPSMMFVGFAVGALVSGVFAWFMPEAYYWQIGIFIIVSLVLLPFTRRFAKKITGEPPSQSNIDALIGQVALVTGEIDPDLGGKVVIQGETWRAVAEENIGTNEKVVIEKVVGTKLHVKKKDA